jgi:uncharacterized protein (TIGR02996 family)
MTDDDAFLLAIAQDPGSAVDKLAYADFLEERQNPGDERLAATLRLWLGSAYSKTSARNVADDQFNDLPTPDFAWIEEELRLQEVVGNYQQALNDLLSKIGAAKRRNQNKLF